MSSSKSDTREALLQELRSLRESAKKQASDRFLTTTEVALLFEVSERTVRVWAKRNRISRMYTPGGRWKFPALETLLVYEKSLH